MASLAELVASEPSPETNPSCLLCRVILGCAVGLGLLLIGVMLALAFLMLRPPGDGTSVRVTSQIWLPPARSLLAGTDYASVLNGTLLVCYPSANQLLAVNNITNSVRTYKTGLDGIHGVAFSERPKAMFASLGKANKVAVFDSSRAGVRRDVPTGQNPDGIVFDDRAGFAYVANGKSRSATLIDPKDLYHPVPVLLGGSPEYPQVDEASGLIFQPLEDVSEIVVIDPLARQVVKRVALTTCKHPTGSAIDAEHRVLYIGCSNRRLAVMNLGDGRILAEIPIARFVDVVAWDAALGRVYTAHAAGSVTVIQRKSDGKYQVIDSVRTRAGGHTLAVDPRTHRVYVICSGLLRASVIVYEAITSPNGK